MKQKYIATIGALALTLPALAMAQTPGTQQDAESRAQQPTQQHEPGSAERGTMQERDRDYGKQHPGTAQPGERSPGTAQQPGERSPGTARQPGERQPGAADRPGDRPYTAAAKHDRKFKLDNLTGEDLVDQQGEQIGTIDDVLLTQDGRIASVLITTGGVMGIGGETKAVDWDRLDVQFDEDGSIREVRTTMTEQELENLPDYDDDEGMFD
jgi:sporulation protein YlmC with PRC-barrel domain